jgi:hypothetical protein
MKIFLSVSFSHQVDAQGAINPAYRSDLEILIQKLEEENHEVFCAPRAEGWRVTDHDPVHALRADFKEIDGADVYVAVLTDRVSAGVQLETGYALARDKRIVLASPSGTPLEWTNNALTGFENVSSVNFEFYDQLADQILQVITR